MFNICLERCFNFCALRTFGNGCNKILSRRSFVRIAFHMQLNTRLKTIFTHVAFQHCQYAATFLIGNAVEGTGDLVIVVNWLANLSCCSQGVVGHCAERTF